MTTRVRCVGANMIPSPKPEHNVTRYLFQSLALPKQEKGELWLDGALHVFVGTPGSYEIGREYDLVVELRA